MENFAWQVLSLFSFLGIIIILIIVLKIIEIDSHITKYVPQSLLGLALVVFGLAITIILITIKPNSLLAAFLLHLLLVVPIGYYLGYSAGKHVGQEIENVNTCRYQQIVVNAKKDVEETIKQIDSFTEGSYEPDEMTKKEIEELIDSEIIFLDEYEEAIEEIKLSEYINKNLISKSNRYLRAVVTKYDVKQKKTEEGYLDEIIETYNRDELRSKYLMIYALETGKNRSAEYKPLTALSKFTKVKDGKFESGLEIFTIHHQMTKISNMLLEISF